MHFSASGLAAIPIILLSTVIPLIIFILIPALIVRSILKAIRKQLPGGASVRQLIQISKELPKGSEWQEFKHRWEIKTDPVTQKITIQRKPDVPLPVGKDVPTEIKISDLSELPGIVKKLSKETQSATIQEPPSRPLYSASSSIRENQGPGSPPSFQSPKSYEVLQTVKRVALIILGLGLFYGIKVFLT